MNDPQLYARLAQQAVKSWQPYYDRPTAVNGFVVSFRAPFMAQVGSVIVTNYDCSECGDITESEGCRHLDAMLDAYQMIRDDLMAQRDYEELQDRRWAAQRGVL